MVLTSRASCLTAYLLVWSILVGCGPSKNNQSGDSKLGMDDPTSPGYFQPNGNSKVPPGIGEGSGDPTSGLGDGSLNSESYSQGEMNNAQNMLSSLLPLLQQMGPNDQDKAAMLAYLMRAIQQAKQQQASKEAITKLLYLTLIGQACKNYVAKQKAKPTPPPAPGQPPAKPPMTVAQCFKKSLQRLAQNYAMILANLNHAGVSQLASFVGQQGGQPQPPRPY